MARGAGPRKQRTFALKSRWLHHQLPPRGQEESTFSLMPRTTSECTDRYAVSAGGMPVTFGMVYFVQKV